MSGMEKDSERDMVGAGGGGFRSGGGGEGRVRIREEGTMLDGGRRTAEIITRKVGSNTFAQANSLDGSHVEGCLY